MKVAIVLLAVPSSLIGAFRLIFLLGYNMSVAVWVGIIALAGVDAETGVIMLLYLDQAFDKFKKAGKMHSLAELQAAVEDGAAKRIRPKMMTVLAILLGLLPIMWGHGAVRGARGGPRPVRADGQGRPCHRRQPRNAGVRSGRRRVSHASIGRW